MTLNLVTITEGDAPLEEREAALEAAGEKISGLPANAVLNDDGTITLRLTWPAAIKFKAADQTVREEPIEDLVFHRLKGADLRAIMNTKAEGASLLLFNRSTRKGDGRGPLTFDALDAVDARAALDIVGFLSGAGVRTGR